MTDLVQWDVSRCLTRSVQCLSEGKTGDARQWVSHAVEASWEINDANVHRRVQALAHCIRQAISDEVVFRYRAKVDLRVALSGYGVST